jgi:hypothetical protein
MLREPFFVFLLLAKEVYGVMESSNQNATETKSKWKVSRFILKMCLVALNKAYKLHFSSLMFYYVNMLYQMTASVV